MTVNPSLLLGPGDDRLSSTRDVLQFLAGDIKICPSGGLNFVDARDVAAVLPVAMERGRPGERYLLGGYNWTFAEFFNRLARQTKLPAPWLKAPRGKLSVYATEVQAALYRKLGRTPPLEPKAVEMAGYFWYFDSTKARDELGFQARDSADTLHDTVTYLRQHVLGRQPLVTAAQTRPPRRSRPRPRTAAAAPAAAPRTSPAAAPASRRRARWGSRPNRRPGVTSILRPCTALTFFRDRWVPEYRWPILVATSILVKSPTTTRSSRPSSRVLVGQTFMPPPK